MECYRQRQTTTDARKQNSSWQDLNWLKAFCVSCAAAELPVLLICAGWICSCLIYCVTSKVWTEWTRERCRSLIWQRSLRVAIFTRFSDWRSSAGFPPPVFAISVGLFPVCRRPLPLRAAAVAVSSALLPPVCRASAVSRSASAPAGRFVVVQLFVQSHVLVVGSARRWTGRLQPEGGRREGRGRAVGRKGKQRRRRILDVEWSAALERVPGRRDGRLHVRRVLRQRRSVATSRKPGGDVSVAAERSSTAAGRDSAAVHVRRVRQTLRDVVQLVTTQTNAS